MPVDHFTLCVPQSSFEGIISFLVASLQHIGFKEHTRPVPYAAGLGDKTPYMWIVGIDEKEVKKAPESRLKKEHIAFSVKNADQVKQFHAAALKAGGADNGPPGFRPHFGHGYYAAFVRDPVCGVNFEVLCRNAKEEIGT